MTAPEQPGWAGHRLLDTVASLWPTARVSIAPGRRSGRRKELLFVPNSDRPRLLIPSGHPKAAASALMRFSHSLSLKDRGGRIAAAAALRIGGERVLLHRISIQETKNRPDSIETYLSGVLGQDVVVSLGVGPARANQKPVLQAFHPSGRSLAFVKIGDSPRTRELVRGEAASLQTVGDKSFRSLAVPQLLHLGTWNSFEVLVISTLASPALPRLRRTALTTPPERAMRELSEAFDEGEISLPASPFVAQMHTTANGLEDPMKARIYGEAIDRIADEYRDARLRFGAWHGDWSPWNMGWRRGKVHLWDWERFETGVPAGMDRIHYVLNTVVRTHGFTAESIDRALGLADIVEYPDATQQRALGLSYLASIAGRYLVGSQGADGAVLRQTAHVVLDALTRHSRTPQEAFPR